MPEIMIPQAAVEAGAKEVWRWYVSPSLDGFDKHAYAYDSEKATEAAQAVLEAALPHIREALAEEVDQYAEADDTDGGMGPDFYSGLYRAAHIVRGEQP